ncbi:MAG: type IV pilin protein [Thiotrichaceae bacterium]|nr:type IV pilin protein [Thiotrichaceae bacterium]
MYKRSKGFTLIELMIAVAIMGILITIAVPAYNGYLVKSRRADAKTSLLTIAQLQETYFADNNAYADKEGNGPLSKLRVERQGFLLVDGVYQSKDGYYKLDFEKLTPTYFVARATPLDLQRKGEEGLEKYCYIFLLDSRGIKTISGTSSNTANAQSCWN